MPNFACVSAVNPMFTRLLRMRLLPAILLTLLPITAPCAADSLEAIHRQWQQLRDAGDIAPAFGELVFIAPDAYSAKGATAGLPSSAAQRTTTQQLFELAERAAQLGEAALALRLATEAVHADPACEPARRALGYERHDGQWLTPYQLRMAKRGEVWHGKYGWIAPDDLPQYEEGRRKHRGRWITSDVDARLHSDIRQGWQVRTDHFNVTTNHSLEAAAGLAAQLEQLYQVWQQLFADFHLDDRKLRDRFAQGRVPGVRARPFQVVFHRSRDEYNAALRSRQPRIAETIGIYFDHQREAHFFAADDGIDRPTLYHEAVHQLFFESVRATRDPGRDDNFWAIEGVALWFESLRRHETERGLHFTIGEPDAGRLPAARQRRLVDGYRVPLAELVAFGKRDFQERTDLAPLYSQAAGLGHFFVQTPEFRPAFVAYLGQIYAGRAEPATLAELTGRDYAELDTQYEAFLREAEGFR